jgi:hypothetical protein
VVSCAKHFGASHLRQHAQWRDPGSIDALLISSRPPPPRPSWSLVVLRLSSRPERAGFFLRSVLRASARAVEGSWRDLFPTHIIETSKTSPVFEEITTKASRSNPQIQDSLSE